MKKRVLPQKIHPSLRADVSKLTNIMEEKVAPEMMRKREKMELRQQQRELELLAKREAMELAAT